MARAQAERTTRPRDSQATKELLLAAATAEFAEHGLAGARIDRIGERAGVNKRLLYVYFGDKQQLFDVVLERQLEQLVAAVPFDATDLPGFAAARFDYMLANPETARLVNWRIFDRAVPAEWERRGFKARVDAVAAAQREGKLRSDIRAIDMYAIVLRMSESWLGAPPALKDAAGKNPLSPKRVNEHRDALLGAVRSVAEAGKKPQQAA